MYACMYVCMYTVPSSRGPHAYAYFSELQRKGERCRKSLENRKII